MNEQKTWITADWHIGEKDQRIRQRPFIDALDAMRHMINAHNTLVKPTDKVIVVGDAVYKEKGWLPMVKDFHGIKTLIRGNHDAIFTDEELKPYFETIIPENSGLEMMIPCGINLPVYITHYPSQSCGNRFNLVAHVHAAWKVQLNMLNVGVDTNHFRPMNLFEDIPFYYNAICNHYDRDIFAAYSVSNRMWFNERGVKSDYMISRETPK